MLLFNTIYDAFSVFLFLDRLPFHAFLLSAARLGKKIASGSYPNYLRIWN